MKKFFALLFLAILIIAVKSDDDYYEDMLKRKRIEEAISCLHDKNIWTEMMARINKARQQYYRDDDYLELQLVRWCNQYCNYPACKEFVDEYYDD